MNGVVGFVLGIFLLMVLLEGAGRSGRLPAWVARKLLHMGVGVLVLLYARSGAWNTLVVVSLGFALFNLAERLLRFTTVSRSQPDSWGTVLFPLAVAWLAWTHPGDPVFFYALSAMFFADALAAFAGQRFPLRRLGPKSLGGSLAFVFITFLIGLPFFTPAEAALLAGLATLTEVVSDRGLDNLLVPLLLGLWVDTLRTHPATLYEGLVFATLVALVAWRLRALTLRGSVAAGLLGLVIWSAGRWSFALPLLLFFALGSLATRLHRKERAEIRTPIQVLANGWVAGFFAFLHHLHPHPACLVGFLSGVCEAAADTLATETGGPHPRDILTGHPVPRGTSGGVTRQGFLGALAGSFLVATSGVALSLPGMALLTAALAGFAGNVVDSLLGARLQGRWRCRVCGKEVETLWHCGEEALHVRGWRWLDNNGVNALSGFLAGLGGCGLWLWLSS